jgi:thiosulfate/3-mercaptopyruvate sulfurtransferase
MNRFATLLIGFALLPTVAASAQYVRPELLVEPAELAKPEVAADFIILDVRSQAAYDQSHIPGARRVDHDVWKAAFDDGDDAGAWSQRIGALGIDADANVVVYDDAALKNAARIWWLLRYWGVDNARLLNGDWQTWTADGLPVTRDVPDPATAAVFGASPVADRLLFKDELLDLLGGGQLQVIDSRSEGEFCGTTALKNKRAGAIPGAVHLEWSDLIDGESHRFKPAGQMQSLLDEAGIDLARPLTTHCQSGGRASVMVFALELMGADDVSNYYKGWSEWGNEADTPIEPGVK